MSTNKKQSFYNYLYKLQNSLYYPFVKKSYAQEGEDLILARIFGRKKNGFFVDVGAFHPKRFSNTYFFYKHGWRGINIEANPKSIKLFHKIRKRDINLNIPVSDKPDVLKYYMFNEPALNGFSKELSTQRNGQGNYVILNELELKTQRLDEILAEHLPQNQTIDFMSIDVEGFDYQVLISNNWNKFRPSILLVEALDFDIEKPELSKTHVFLKENNYSLYAKAVNTIIYRDNNYC